MWNRNMTRSPKQPHKRDGDGGPPPIKAPLGEIKPILKDGTSMKITPRSTVPVSPPKTKNNRGALPAKKPRDRDRDVEAEYEDLFMDIVMNELPKTDGTYSISNLQDDIVCVVEDIHKTCDYLVIPDQEMLLNVAKEKIDGKDQQMLFVYGRDGSYTKDGAIEPLQSCHEKIRQYTMHVRRKDWDAICDKFSKMDAAEEK